MSGPHRNPDKLNSIGIVVVGICGAVLVYVAIVALQAFYMNDTSQIQTMADYGGQDTAHKSLRAQQLENIQRYEPKAPPPPPKKEGDPQAPQLYSISIDDAIPLVVQAAKRDPSNLVPGIGPAVTPTVRPIFGRPQLLQQPAPAGGDGAAAGGAAAAAAAEGASAAGGASAPMTPTAGQGPGGGAPPGNEGRPVQNPSGAPGKTEERTNPSPKADPGPHAPKVEPKAGGTAPKGGAAPKQPAQPKKGNAS
jgi:hypothetical protein